MSWAESNRERMRGIRGSVSNIANRAFQEKENRKNRFFSSISDLASGIQDKKKAERGRKHDIKLEGIRQEGRESLQRDRQQWNDKQRKEAEKAAAGLEEWRINEYGEGAYENGYYKNPITGQEYTWNDKEDYEFALRAIMQEAAERAATNRSDREPTTWWDAYEKVTTDIMKNRTDIWDGKEFLGWDSADKEAVKQSFLEGIRGHGLDKEQQQDAYDYFVTYFLDEGDGAEEPTEEEETVPEGSSAGGDWSDLFIPTARTGDKYREQPLRDTEKPEPQREAQTSPFVQDFYGSLKNIQEIEPEPAMFQNWKTGEGLWNTVKAIIPSLTVEDVSSLNYRDERRMERLVDSAVSDNKLTNSELREFMELFSKISSSPEERVDRH